MQPLVTALITSYNHERYIVECIESALGQTYSPLEVIVIDDKSKDRSPEILRSYEHHIRLVLNETNKGTYPVLNQGLELATGKYVAILNSDDLWLPDKIARQVELMESNSRLSFCHTYGDFIDENGSIVSGEPMGFPFPRTKTGDMLHVFVANNTAIASSVMMRTQLAREVGGFDPTFRNLGDWDMWLRLAEKGEVGFVDEKLTLYRIHGSNTIYNIETTRSEEFRIREHLYERRSELAKRSPQMRSSLSHTIACLGSLYSITGDARRARQLFCESLRLNPLRFKSVLRWCLTFAPISLRRKLM